jgi:hypothetical protein
MTAEPLPKQKVQVLGRAMAYHESGEGDPILSCMGIQRPLISGASHS